jgi:hypothetical protein
MQIHGPTLVLLSMQLSSAVPQAPARSRRQQMRAQPSLRNAQWS